MELIDRKEITVRFGEVDSMAIVWHGNYIKYFEDGRESFGSKYDLGYLDVHRHNVMIPIVKVTCDFKKTAGLRRYRHHRNTVHQFGSSKDPV